MHCITNILAFCCQPATVVSASKEEEKSPVFTSPISNGNMSTNSFSECVGALHSLSGNLPEVQSSISDVEEVGEDFQKTMLKVSRIALSQKFISDEFINRLDLYLKNSSISARHTFSSAPIYATGKTVLMEAIYQLGVSIEAGRDTNLFLDAPGIELNARCIENNLDGRKSTLGFTLDHFLGMSSKELSLMESLALKLIESGADISLPCNSNDDSPLIRACKIRFEKVAESLIEKGANIHEKNSSDLDTPLHVACDGMLPRLVKRLHDVAHQQLIEKISLVIELIMPTPLVSLIDGYVGMSWFSSVQNCYGHTPLHGLVSFHGSYVSKFEIRNAQCYHFLLEKGGVELCNIKNKIGLTPLFTAADRGKDDRVRHMLEMGADYTLIPDSHRGRNSNVIKVVDKGRAEISNLILHS